jgi:thiamine biosynthesis lipoprotein
VKGWAVERAAELLTSRGVPNSCINAGGDIALRGEYEPGRPWRIGIRHPDDPMALAFVLERTGPIGIATSATYERGAHIIDPRDGLPATPVASATVVGRDLAEADAHATTVFVMGVEGLTWLLEHTDHEGYVITHDGRTYATPGFVDVASSGGRTLRNMNSSNRS